MGLLPGKYVEMWGGMECTINRVKNNYFDQMDYSGHHSRMSDIDAFADLGLKKMRYPILWERHQPDEHQPVNWDITAAKLNALRNRNVEVIAGLVHHGSGPAFVNILDDSFAKGLAEYALLVAQKFPWINYYTPINEPLTTARFCGLYGLWYPHKKDDESFCRILINECKATLMAMKAIRTVNPAATLIQTDDVGKVHSTSLLRYQADFENERRWLSYDLLCGRVDRNHSLWPYLRQNGITADDLDYFLLNPAPPEIIGVNYYLTSERYLDERKKNYPIHTHGRNGRHTYADVEAVRVGKVNPDGIKEILRAVFDRYNIPVAVTEVHLHCTREEQMRWLKYVWDAACSLNTEGIKVVAITPWALLGSFGWDQLLTKHKGKYESGVFDLSGGYRRATVLAAMVCAYSKQQPFNHPVLDIAGWWQRKCRIVYGRGSQSHKKNASGPELLISGRYTAELVKICENRGLNYAETTNKPVWATIKTGAHLKIQTIGRADLVVALSGCEISRILNAGLDLFLDGETGYWVAAQDGGLSKLIPQINNKTQQHILAS